MNDLAPGDVTVAVCTYNRAELLPNLSTYLLDIQSSGARVLLVDNSSDESALIQNKSLAAKCGFDYHYSTPPGLSRARNAAIEMCETEILAFLDDDAIPGQHWLEGLLDAFESESVGFVAGRILPGWPGDAGPPEWLPQRLIGCLSVLDLGDQDRQLEDFESAYGANMAFRKAALSGSGGFSVALGRTGNASLLSNEELETQEKIRALGYTGRYSAKGVVTHLIEQSRLSRHWFIARMAWQGASDSLMVSSPDQAALLDNLRVSARKVKAGALVDRIVNPRSAKEFDASLQFVRDLCTYTLSATGMPDDLPANDDKSGFVENLRETALSSPCPTGTEVAFFDGLPGHHFLYEQYADIARTSFAISDGWAWSDTQRSDLEYFELSLIPSVKTVVFLTLDQLAYGPGFDRTLGFMQEQSGKRNLFGFVHRLPGDHKLAERLTMLAEHMQFIVFEEGMAGTLNEITRKKASHYLPLHPVFSNLVSPRVTAKKKLGIDDDKIVISMLGELRRGKGVERLLRALPRIRDKLDRPCLFLIAGKATDVTPETLQKQFRESGLDLSLYSGVSGSGYKFVSDQAMADCISASDIGLLLYEEEQTTCMSGVLPNYVMGGCQLVCSEASIVGNLSRRYDLGIQVDVSNPEAIADAIAGAVASLDSRPASAARDRYIESISAGAVTGSFRKILGLE